MVCWLHMVSVMVHQMTSGPLSLVLGSLHRLGIVGNAWPNLFFSYRPYGFYAYLGDLFDCPEPIMKVLQQMYKVHEIPVGSKRSYDQVEQILQRFPRMRKFYTDNHRVRWFPNLVLIFEDSSNVTLCHLDYFLLFLSVSLCGVWLLPHHCTNQHPNICHWTLVKC